MRAGSSHDICNPVKHFNFYPPSDFTPFTWHWRKFYCNFWTSSLTLWRI